MADAEKVRNALKGLRLQSDGEEITQTKLDDDLVKFFTVCRNGCVAKILALAVCKPI